MSNTDTSVGIFIKILTALSTLNIDQLQAIDDVTSKITTLSTEPRVKQVRFSESTTPITEQCVSSPPEENSIENGVSIPAPVSPVNKFALVLSVDGISTVYAIGTRDECLKRLKRHILTEVDSNTWIWESRTVTLSPIKDEDLDVTPENCGDDVPKKIVMLLDNNIPCGTKSFNNSQAVAKFISGKNQNDYRVVSL